MKLTDCLLGTTLGVLGFLPLAAIGDPNNSLSSDVNNGVPAAADTGNGNAAALNNTATSHEVRQVQRMLARAIGDITTRGDLDDFIGYLSKPTRDRIGTLKGDEFKDLDAKIDQFNNDFKARYNASFSLWSSRDILDNIAVQLQGKTQGSALLSDHPFSGQSLFDKKDQDNAANGDASRNATVAAGNAANSNRVTVTLLNEGSVMNEWRIDAAQIASADQLKQNLMSTFDQLSQNKASWPADRYQASREIAVRLLQGALGQSANGQAAPSAVNR
jgi:hypothetical protein